MKWTKTLLALSLLLLGASLVEAQDWTGRGRLQGQVTDPNKDPIQGATVTLRLNGDESKGPAPMTTDKKGRWSALGLATGNWTILIEAEGFVTSEGSARVISAAVGPGQTVRVQLREIPKEVAEAATGPDIGSMIERGNALLLEKKYAEARGEYQSALAEIEELEFHPPILLGIARTYFEEDKVDDAIATLETTLEIDPVNQDALKLISTMLMNEGREEEAEAYMARIEGDFKVDPNSLLNLGIAAFNDNKMNEAADYFDRVVAENPDLPDAYYYRGLVHLNKGNIEAAKADFQKLLALAPDHANAAEARDFLEAL